VTIAIQADVEAVLLRTLTANESTYIAALLGRVDALIFGELPGYKFDGVANDSAVDLIGLGTFEVWLPGRPVTKVESVTLDGAPVPAAVYRETGFTWHRFGDLSYEGGVWPLGSTIHVVYDYGLAAAPADLKWVAADIVRQGLTTPAGSNVQSQRYDDYAVTFFAAAEAISAIDLGQYGRILGRYRYPVAV